jgi:hypothetical protein
MLCNCAWRLHTNNGPASGVLGVGVRCCVSSDAHGPAQSRKPAEAGPVEAEPSEAAWAAYDGSRLRLEDIKAGSRGSSRGFWRPSEYQTPSPVPHRPHRAPHPACRPRKSPRVFCFFSGFPSFVSPYFIHSIMTFTYRMPPLPSHHLANAARPLSPSPPTHRCHRRHHHHRRHTLKPVIIPVVAATLGRQTVGGEGGGKGRSSSRSIQVLDDDSLLCIFYCLPVLSDGRKDYDRFILQDGHWDRERCGTNSHRFAVGGDTLSLGRHSASVFPSFAHMVPPSPTCWHILLPCPSSSTTSTRVTPSPPKTRRE